MAGRPLTLLVPGPWTDASLAARLDARWSVEWVANDGDFVDAVRSFGAFGAEELERIGCCAGALVVEGTVDLPAEGPAILELGGALVGAGALAVRVEQSRVAWPAARWVALLERGDWFPAFVLLVVDDGAIETCGMHLFSRPDARVVSADRDEGGRVVRSLCEYQLDEDPLLLSGQTFRPDEAAPRRVLERWPVDGFAASHPCHNPFGVWRLGEGERAAPDRLALTFMPALVAVLLAAERDAGRPLTQAEVEAIRDRAACMAMEPRHAQALERSRGYADLDPQLVWAQWQLARTALVGT